MENNHRTALIKSFDKGQDKDKHFWAQMQKVFAAFHKQHRTALKVFGKGQGKYKYFQSQMQRAFAAFYKQPKTMLMVSIETGILRANVCRYVAKWEKQNVIRLVRKGICPISKHRAGFYTTNPELFPSIVEPSNTVSHETCTCI